MTETLSLVVTPVAGTLMAGRLESWDRSTQRPRRRGRSRSGDCGHLGDVITNRNGVRGRGNQRPGIRYAHRASRGGRRSRAARRHYGSTFRYVVRAAGKDIVQHACVYVAGNHARGGNGRLESNRELDGQSTGRSGYRRVSGFRIFSRGYANRGESAGLWVQTDRMPALFLPCANRQREPNQAEHVSTIFVILNWLIATFRWNVWCAGARPPGRMQLNAEAGPA